MNKATQRNYIEHFGPDAFVPGYCGKCPGAGRVGDDPVCTVYADDPAPRILPDPQGCNEPPDWCPIRHISRQPLLAEVTRLTEQNGRLADEVLKAQDQLEMMRPVYQAALSLVEDDGKVSDLIQYVEDAAARVILEGISRLERGSAEVSRQWISVEDRLPPTCNRVFVAIDVDGDGTRLTVGIAHQKIEGGTWYEDDVDGWCDSLEWHSEVSHWMPLPTHPASSLKSPNG